MNEKAELLIKACEEAGVVAQIIRDQDIHIGAINPQQASDIVTYIQKAGDVE